MAPNQTCTRTTPLVAPMPQLETRVSYPGCEMRRSRGITRWTRFSHRTLKFHSGWRLGVVQGLHSTSHGVYVRAFAESCKTSSHV